MKTIGIFEAKTHLSEIIDNVTHGQEYLITRRGVSVARLSMFEKAVNSHSTRQVVEELMKLRQGRRATQKEIKGWINEGRR